MRHVVIIASIGRREVLGRTLEHLERQVRAPDEVVLSIVSASDAPDVDTSSLKIRKIESQKGLAAQRNTALRATLPGADIITFLDDDFLPADDYLARVESAFVSNENFAGVHGNVVADGICGVGLTFEEGLAALRSAASAGLDDTPPLIEDLSAYGCNMSFRASLIRDLYFDERLVLYGWQEDRDFSFRVAQRGRVVRVSNIIGVHLGVKGGRVSGLRLGYSQVANPAYLYGKGTMSLRSASNLMFRNMAANVIRSFFPEQWVDRRGRLRGNMIAIVDLITGRVEPERVLKL